MTVQALTHPQTSDMTLDAYRGFVARTAAAYPCLGFEVLDAPALPPRFALLRHDIDMSPQQALETARIEADLGVRATYTVLLTGEFYSPFEAGTRALLQEIRALGHDIGLHFDAAYHQINDDTQMDDALIWEADILSRLLVDDAGPAKIKMFSFHNTTPFTMSCRASHYAGLRNAYAGILQDACEYTSDSNGYWIHRTWDAILAAGHDRLQVLTHPEWWHATDAEPAEKLCQIMDQRIRDCWDGYQALLRRGNRINRTGLPLNIDKIEAILAGEEAARLPSLWLAGYHGIAAAGLLRSLNQAGIPLEETDHAILSGNQGNIASLQAAFVAGLEALAEQGAQS
ncbi:hypothetical protein FHS89_000545 [Rubricella aquisinus]|uniref:Uncharacterized protein n=1 Tax=Rubricella aquisinus TaxID=2028108 RepID=A0A840X1K1_9RHOB|nr:hypothetical protein [Rubricella aquisinus]MBB5514547.1 hypothetical protein [Rubricella aquisinus]